MLQIYSIYFCTLKFRKSLYLLWVIFTKNEKTITDNNENPYIVCYKALNVICHFSLSKKLVNDIHALSKLLAIEYFKKNEEKSLINFYYN